MTVMIDELQFWGQTRYKTCHLVADTVDELKQFRNKLSEEVKKHVKWHSGASTPHYDIMGSRSFWVREECIKAGAVYVPARDQAQARIEKRRCQKQNI